MTISNKIRHIRNFRGLTQKKLGLKIGLDVNIMNFTDSTPGYAEDIMFTFFWMDEENRGV